MQRTVKTPADLSGAALDDLKGWLGISRPKEDALLISLLGASVAMCEAFTGQAPIEQIFEESIPGTAGAHRLSTRPVRVPLSVERIGQDNAQFPLAESEYDFAVSVDRTATVTLANDIETSAVIVTFEAGIADDWSEVPDALKQGMIRLAAFHYRDREMDSDAAPPASVAALWRPWRQVRLT